MSSTRPSTENHQRERTRNAWNVIATGFDEFLTPQSMTLAKDALKRVGLRPGMRFLDVAAGTGALSLPAARLGAKVLATDISTTMIEQLRKRARDEGLDDLEARPMDGQDLDLEDALFDVVGSQNGVSLFPDLKRGLREMVRVTKPNGRVLIVAFGNFRKTEFIGFFVAALQATVPGFTGLPADTPPLPFQVSDVAKLREEMTAAGLKDVHIDTTDWRMEFRSGSHLWNTVTASHPIGSALVADVTDEQKAETLQVLDGMLRERSGGTPAAVLTSEVNIGIGVK